jgi:hypothetical protein
MIMLCANGASPNQYKTTDIHFNISSCKCYLAEIYECKSLSLTFVCKVYICTHSLKEGIYTYN